MDYEIIENMTNSNNINNITSDLQDANQNYNYVYNTNNTANMNIIPNYSTYNLFYDEEQDIIDEKKQMEFHKNKNTGKWKVAKYIVLQSTLDDNKNRLENVQYLWDALESSFKSNNDDFNNIYKVYYTNNKLFNNTFEFDSSIAKYIVDNIKIPKFFSNSFIFNIVAKQNLFPFTIVIVTSKGVYSANRYIDEKLIGFY
jgi:hypothetical protein